MTIAGMHSRLDRFSAVMFAVAVVTVVVADAISFLNTGTIEQDLFWSNFSVFGGIACYTAVKRLEQ